MKKTLLVSIFLLICTSSAWSLAVYDPDLGLTYVGDPDSLVPGGAIMQSQMPNSGDQSEIDWINSVLGTSYTVDNLSKIDTPEGAGWLQTFDDDGLNEIDFTFAYNFGAEPEYFLVKTGNLNSNVGDYRWFLFSNNNELYDWGVINLQGYNLLEIGKLSHLDTVGGAPVPEPATLLLIGSGLLGLAGFRKQRKS
jgi:hypothetical protein